MEWGEMERPGLAVHLDLLQSSILVLTGSGPLCQGIFTHGDFPSDLPHQVSLHTDPWGPLAHHTVCVDLTPCENRVEILFLGFLALGNQDMQLSMYLKLPEYPMTVKKHP